MIFFILLLHICFQIGILLTDGRSNQGHSVSDAARQLRQRGVNMFSIGIGSNLNMYELRDVATDPDSTHVFRLDGFDNLSEFVDQMSTVACDGECLAFSFSVWGIWKCNFCPPEIEFVAKVTLLLWSVWYF